MLHKLLVRCLFLLASVPFSSKFAISLAYYSELDHRPRIINEKVLHSQSHAVSNGM